MADVPKLLPPTNAIIEPSSELERLRRELLELEERARPLVAGTSEAARVELSFAARALNLLEAKQRGDVERSRNAWQEARKLQQLEERNALLGKRVTQLEGIVVTAFMRAVRALSGDMPVAQRQAEAATRLMTEAIEAQTALEKARVPGTGLLDRVRLMLVRMPDPGVVDAAGVEVAEAPAAMPALPPGESE